MHGCGGVGLSAVMIAAARGAQIIAVDISPTALKLARTLGATTTLDPGYVDVVSAVRDLTDGGAGVSIDALGSIETCLNSIRSLRKRGRHVQVGLMLGADEAPRRSTRRNGRRTILRGLHEEKPGSSELH